MTVKVCLKCGRKYSDLSRNRCDCGGPLLYKADPSSSLKAAPLNPKAKEYYYVARSPRLITLTEPETIDLEKPPVTSGPPQINWLSVLLTPAISIGLMIVLVKVMGMSPVMLIMAGVMSAVSAVIAVVTYLNQKKRHRQRQEKIIETYQKYIAVKSNEIEEKHTRQLNSLLRTHPSPEECLSIVCGKDKRLWERQAGDEDFMSVRLGLGTISAAVTAEFKRPEVVIEENELENKAEELANASKTIEGAPILCDLLHCKSLGIVGKRKSSIQLARNIIVEAATAHTYADLRIVALFPEQEFSDWAWIKWLPHCSLWIDNVYKDRCTNDWEG